jgi:hypothetical protein
MQMMMKAAMTADAMGRLSARPPAVGGGKAVIPSNVKVAAGGTSLDVPLSHKDDSWSFDHFDTLRCRFRMRQNQTKSSS